MLFIKIELLLTEVKLDFFPTWCPGEDSNLHSLTATSTSRMRVYHFTTWAGGPFIAQFLVPPFQQVLVRLFSPS